MGLFSGKKKIIVSSSIYNLAGDIKNRPNFLPLTIIGQALGNKHDSMSDAIQHSLMTGSGIRYRQFARWAQKSGYNENTIKLETGKLFLGDSIDPVVLEDFLSDKLRDFRLHSAFIEQANFAYWAERYLLTYYPEQIEDVRETDYDEQTNTIFITFNDDSVISFVPEDFDKTADYLHVNYSFHRSFIERPIITNNWITVASPSNYPDVTGWDLINSVDTQGTNTLTTTTVVTSTFSDSRPPETNTTTSSSTGTYVGQVREYKHNEYLGANGNYTQLLSTNHFVETERYYDVVSNTTSTTTTETIETSVIKTTVTTVTVQSLVPRYRYRTKTQEIVNKEYYGQQWLIYKHGDGEPVLDAMFLPDTDVGEFFPFIPVRYYNTFYSDSYRPEVYKANLKAYKKAFGKNKYDEVVETVKDNPSIGDIDFAYIAFGTSLNTLDNRTRKYIYRFFETMKIYATGSEAAYLAWQTEWNIANASQLEYVSWLLAQSDELNPLFGTPEPTLIPYPVAPESRLRVASKEHNYDMTILWSSIAESSYTGLYKPDAKQGSCWVEVGATNDFDEILINAGVVGYSPQSKDFTTVTLQTSPTTYSQIRIWGLQHRNTIYKGKSVGTYAKSAIEDTEESGFLIPLHDGIYREINLVDATQMGVACAYMVFNSYDVVKQKWYSTGAFKIVVIVVIVIIAVYTGYVDFTGAGLLGSAADVGAMLGLQGTIGTIVGAIANAVAAMIVTQVVSMAATALLGDEIGAIVGAVVSAAVISMGTSMASGTSGIDAFNSLTKSDNLIRLSMATAKGVQIAMQDRTNKVLEETQELMNYFERRSEELTAKWEENIGYGLAGFDPTILTEAVNTDILEPANVFLQRSLMTGMDIAEMTNSMVSTFTRLTIDTDLII